MTSTSLGVSGTQFWWSDIVLMSFIVVPENQCIQNYFLVIPSNSYEFPINSRKGRGIIKPGRGAALQLYSSRKASSHWMFFNQWQGGSYKSLWEVRETESLDRWRSDKAGENSKTNTGLLYFEFLTEKPKNVISLLKDLKSKRKYLLKMASDSLIGFCEIKRKPDSN